MSYTFTQAIRASRRKAAELRQEAYDKLTVQQKLDKLPEGRCEKQRKKLLAKKAV